MWPATAAIDSGLAGGPVSQSQGSRLWLFRTAALREEWRLGDRYVIATVVTTESRDTADPVLYSPTWSASVYVALAVTTVNHPGVASTPYASYNTVKALPKKNIHR